MFNYYMSNEQKYSEFELGTKVHLTNRLTN